jgi:hypothetical protein
LLKIGTVAADEFTKTPSGCLALLALGLASRPVSGFGRIEADQADVRPAIAKGDGIAVDNMDGD